MGLRTYTLHLPSGAIQGEPAALDRAVVVADGFSWPAFAFSVLWFLWHRLWLAAVLVALLLAGLAIGGRLFGLHPLAGLAMSLLAGVLIGLEASSLRRWTYAMQGRSVRDAVVALSRDEAETKLFARWLDPSALRAIVPTSSLRRQDDVIGLFPLSEGGR